MGIKKKYIYLYVFFAYTVLTRYHENWRNTQNGVIFFSLVANRVIKGYDTRYFAVQYTPKHIFAFYII